MFKDMTELSSQLRLSEIFGEPEEHPLLVGVDRPREHKAIAGAAHASDDHFGRLRARQARDETGCSWIEALIPAGNEPMGKRNLTITDCRKSLGHFALHYRSPQDGPAVVRFLDLLGVTRLPSPQSYPYYRYVVDGRSADSGDNILYVPEQPRALRELNTAIRETLRVGQPSEHPAVVQVRAGQSADPEFNLHLGVSFSSIETIEETVRRVRDTGENDSDLRGRVKIVINRARRGNENIDKRLDDSPVFADIDRYTYGNNGIQVFVETDLFVVDPLGDCFVFKLDYVFPGYADNILINPTGLLRAET